MSDEGLEGDRRAASARVNTSAMRPSHNTNTPLAVNGTNNTCLARNNLFVVAVALNLRFFSMNAVQLVQL
jgi:hypothetical protein